MRNTRKISRSRHLFLWTVRGKPYFILLGCSLAILILALGVM